MLKFDFSFAFKENLGTGLSKDEVFNNREFAKRSLLGVIESEPGFLRILKTDEYLDEVEALKDWVKDFVTLVVVGIGGSALGNLALHASLKPMNWNLLSEEEREGNLRVFVVDNVDPHFVGSVIEQIDLDRTLFNVISKSGTTAEAMANYLVVRGLLEKRGLDISEHLIFTTDPEKGVLRQIAKEEGIRTLTIPQDVGGRFSVLTPVGLFSAMAEGIDIRKLYEGARNGVKRYSESSADTNPVLVNALLHYSYLKAGKSISVMMPYSNQLYLLADWYRQLWAESLGKKYDLDGNVVNTGQTPVKALGAVDQHSQIQLYNEGPKDKIVTFLKLEKFPGDLQIPELHSEIEALSYLGGKSLSELLNSEQEGTAMALTENGVPNLTLRFDELSESSVGEFIIYYELLTAVMGAMLNINPYDQPGVELGKKITYSLMGRKGYEAFAGKFSEKKWRFEL